MARSSWRWNNDRSKQTVSDGPTLFPESLWTVKAIVSRNCWIIEESWSRDIEHCQTKFNKPCKRFFKYSWNDLFGSFDSVLCAIFFLFFFWGYIKYACDWVSALIFQRWNNFGNLLKYFLHFELKDSEIFLFFFVYRIFIFRRKVWRLNRGLRERGFGWTFHDFAENENNGTLKSFIIPFIPSTSSVSFFALSG